MRFSGHNTVIMKPIARFVLPTILCCAASSVYACYNDRDSDSLALQAQQLPETLRVITGRFERNPPLYYQMRIERSQQQLQQNPKRFALYDDIAVAQEKLGRDDAALQTIERKRQLLPTFNAKDKANKEAWYRYFANAGTFRAHRWLKAGADKATLNEMKSARAQIKRAIEIKPDAHFGRERYQLMAMDWIMARKSAKTDKTFGQWVGARDGWKGLTRESTLQNSHRARAVEGLSGLIVLGGAWQSPDVFEALAAALETRESVTLRHLALLRAQELVNAGKPTFIEFRPPPSNESPFTVYENSSGSALVQNSLLAGFGIGINAENFENLKNLFAQLRTETDEWNTARQDWMTAKLQTGAHPDANANFWNGYRESAPPSLKMDWSTKERRNEKRLQSSLMTVRVTLFLMIACVCFLIWFVASRLRAPRELAS